MRILSALAIMTVAAGIGANPAAAAGDAVHGEQVFKRCQACHSPEAGVNKVGPSLAGVVGRKAGTVPGYHYSDAMKAYGQVWTEETLAPYLHAPKRVVKGTLMAFPGLPSDKDVADVIAYLQSLSQ